MASTRKRRSKKSKKRRSQLNIVDIDLNSPVTTLEYLYSFWEQGSTAFSTYVTIPLKNSTNAAYDKLVNAFGYCISTCKSTGDYVLSIPVHLKDSFVEYLTADKPDPAHLAHIRRKMRYLEKEIKYLKKENKKKQSVVQTPLIVQDTKVTGNLVPVLPPIAMAPPPPPPPPPPMSLPKPKPIVPIKRETVSRPTSSQFAVTDDLLKSIVLKKANTNISTSSKPKPLCPGDIIDKENVVRLRNTLKRVSGINRSPGGTPIREPLRAVKM